MKKNEIFIFNQVSVGINHSCILHNVSMVIFKEEITGILCENSVPCEALLELFSGEGEVENGRIIYCRDPLVNLKKLKKEHCVIGPVANVISTISIIDNIFFSEYSFCIRHNRKYQTRLQKLYFLFDIQIPFTKKIQELTLVERVQIELLAAYVSKKKFVILYQFSTMFTEKEMEQLLPVIEKLHDLGIAIIVEDSFERFIYNITDKVYILRKGNVVDCLSGKALNEYAVTKAFGMYGNIQEQQEDKETSVSKSMVMRMDQVETKLLKHLDFQLYEGDIFKICYADRPLAEDFSSVFVDERNILSGKIEWKSTAKNFKKSRVGIIYADAVHKVLFFDQTVEFNLLYPAMMKNPKLLRSKSHLQYIRSLLKDEFPQEILHKKVKDVDPVVRISLVCAKWYLYRPDLLLYVKPFPSFYYDGDKKAEYWIKKIAAGGTAVIVLDSNLPSYINLPGKIQNLEPYVKEEP